MADQHYSIWIKSTCPFCVKAQSLALENGLSHTIHVMDEDLEGLEKLKEQWNWTTVPLITTFDGDVEVLVGGCDDFQNSLSSN